MRKFLPLLLAAIMGSGIMYGIVRFTDQNQRIVTIEQAQTPAPIGVAYRMNERGELVPLDFTAAAEKVMPAVVNIRSTVTMSSTQPGQPRMMDPFEFFFGPGFRDQQPQQPRQRQSGGSGVIISADGYIITNAHVIRDASDIQVTLNDNRSYKARVVGSDPTTDIAVIQIREQNLPTLKFGDSESIKVGEWVLAVGNPFNLSSTVTAGIVSAKARNIGILRQDNEYAIEAFIQTDAAINPGNSGGALVNLNGDLIGINTAIQSGGGGGFIGYGFAVPVSIAGKVAKDLIEFGMVQRGLLGVRILDLTAETSKELGLDVVEGAYVESVSENSAAEKAGIQKGDIIIRIDGQRIRSNSDLISRVAVKRPGEKVKVTVRRDGKEKELEAVLKNQQGEADLIAKRPGGGVMSMLGAELEAIDASLAKKLEIPSGVRVKSLKQGIIRQQTDMREGFIITKVDGKPVKTPEEVEKIIAEKEGGLLIEGVYEDMPGVRYFGIGVN